MTPTLDILAMARWLVHERAFSVIPIDHPDDTRNTDPDAIGKTPIVKWKRFQSTRPTDAELVEWFGNGRPRNIAIPTGALSGVVAVDGDSVEGLAWMRAHLPTTPMRGGTFKGEHWYYRHPGVPIKNKVRIRTDNPAIKIDVRGDGGYVVAPGSLHYSRTTYERLGEWPPVADLPVFDPAWLEPESESATPQADPLPSSIPHGRQHDTLFREGCRLRQRGWGEAEIADALWSLHKNRSEGPDVPHEREDVAKIAHSICHQYEPGHTFSQTVESIHEEDVTRPAPIAPYVFTQAFDSHDHFVYQWQAFFAEQCDAAYEFFEATALMALSLATHGMCVHLSGAAEPLRTNLYLAFVGDAAASRKTTAKDFLVKVARAIPHCCGVLPEMSSHEGTVEALSELSGKSALWAIDELKPQLDKLTHATYLAGMLGLVLELYGKTHYTYKRVSKRRKKSEGGNGDREPDDFMVNDVTFSILGCCTPTIFERLTTDAVESGLLPRFGIVWPVGKPERMPRFQSDGRRLHPSVLIQRLNGISARVSISTVRFDNGVLDLLDQQIDLPIEQDPDHSLMLKRMGVMAQKVAMLSAVGRAPSTDDIRDKVIVITEADARAAIIVVRRWMESGKRFESRLNETAFEKKLTKCLDVVRGREGHVNRRDVARRVHMEARVLKEVEATLVQRGQISVVSRQGAMGAPALFWKWLR